MADNIKTGEYPTNLLNEIAGGEWELDLPEDIEATVEYVLFTLTERERKVIHLRYKDMMYLKEASKEFNLTKGRIQQIQIKAVRKLRHPSRRKYLERGIKGCIEDAREYGRQNAITEELNGAIYNIAKIAEGLESGTGTNGSLQAIKEAAEEIKPPLEAIPLEELDLSVRPFNCLLRIGVRTLRDLEAMSVGELKRVRNMGGKSFDEVIEKAHKFGITFRGEDRNI